MSPSVSSPSGVPWDRGTTQPLDFNLHVQNCLERIHIASGQGDTSGVINMIRNLRAELEALKDGQYDLDLKQFNEDLENRVSAYCQVYKKQGQLSEKVKLDIHKQVYNEMIYDLHTILTKLAVRKGLIPIDATYIEWDLKKDLLSLLCPDCREVVKPVANPFRNGDK